MDFICPVNVFHLPRECISLPREVSSSVRECISFAAKSAKAVGVITTHIDDILGRGKPGLLQKARDFQKKRLGKLGAQEKSGEGFLCDAVPGGLYQGTEAISNIPRVITDISRVRGPC